MIRVFNVGDMITYPRDFNFNPLCSIPKEVALAWVKIRFPDKKMDATGHEPVSKMTLENMNNNWLNKRMIVVDVRYNGEVLGLYNHDGEYSLRIKN